MMKSKAKTLESKTRVHYHDCDPFNHLNNSRYIDYIMGARTEQLQDQYGFDAAKLAREQGLGWVAATSQISYFFPAAWMEILTIESRLIHFSEHSVLVEGLMWDEHKTKLKAVLWAKLVHFDAKTQRSAKHTPELMKLFAEVHDPLKEIANFEARVLEMRQQMKS